jgi:hypothetical protein
MLGTVSELKAAINGRTTAGMILEVDNNMIVLDPGIGTVVRASQANIDLNKTNIILSSSPDIIYCNDINAIIDHTDKNIHLICTRELVQHESSVLTLQHAKNLKILTVENEKETNIKNIGISALHTGYALAFKIHTSKYVLGYITKAKYSKAFAEYFKDTNILVINTTILKHDKSPYLDFEEICEMIREIGPELVILSGFSKKMIDQDPLEIARKIKLELQKDKDQPIRTQILPAKELMTINPESYNIRLKQKDLKGFLE